MHASFTYFERPAVRFSTREPLPAPSTHSSSLLLLGDDSPLLDTLQSLLQHAYGATHQVLRARTLEILDRAPAQAVEFVFLSATLPEGRAFAYARTIKARWPSAHMILVAERRLSLLELPLAQALDGCLVAPFAAPQLRQVMEAVLKYTAPASGSFTTLAAWGWA